MPTVLHLAFGKIRVVVYPNDHDPAHVHVKAPDAEARVRIADMAIMSYYGFDRATLKQIVAALTPNRELLQEAWDEFHEE